MRVGTILLTPGNKYCDNSGNLPSRPKHDKTLLTEICSGRRVSQKGYALLPQSIQQLCMVGNAEVPITIEEIAQSELLIVSRSTVELAAGPEFRFDNFKLLVKDRKVELWISKN